MLNQTRTNNQVLFVFAIVAFPGQTGSRFTEVRYNNQLQSIRLLHGSVTRNQSDFLMMSCCFHHFLQSKHWKCWIMSDFYFYLNTCSHLRFAVCLFDRWERKIPQNQPFIWKQESPFLLSTGTHPPSFSTPHWRSWIPSTNHRRSLSSLKYKPITLTSDPSVWPLTRLSADLHRAQ